MSQPKTKIVSPIAWVSVCALVLLIGCRHWRVPNELQVLTSAAERPPAEAPEVNSLQAPPPDSQEKNTGIAQENQGKSKPEKEGKGEPEKEGTGEPAQKKGDSDYEWFESLGRRTSRSPYRWRNNELEQVASEEEGTSELKALLKDKSLAAATGAVIQLARLAPGSQDIELERIARSTSQKTTTRFAAIETLGKSPNSEAIARLERVAKQVRKTLPQQVQLVGAKPIDEDRLLAATISALAELGANLDAFDEFLSPTAAPQTCAALLQAKEKYRIAPLPPAALRCFQHPSPPVRPALLKWSAAVADEQALDEILRITRGGDGAVRFDAIAALASYSNPKATARLEELLHDRAPRTRGAALAAMIRQDSRQAIAVTTAETNWQVKRGVAEFLQEPLTETQWTFAEAFLVDPTAAVAQTLAQTIERWPDEALARALVASLASPHPWVREANYKRLEQLRGKLPFEPLADDDRRAAQLLHLRAAFAFPAAPQAIEVKREVAPLVEIRQALAQWQSAEPQQQAAAFEKLRVLDAALPTVLDTLSIAELRALPPTFWIKVVAAASPRFEIAAALRDSDVQVRRDAARKLAENQNQESLPLCMLVWIDDLLALEEDPLVWRRILPLLARSKGEDQITVIASLAASALPVEALDVRVSACKILESAPPDALYVAALEPLLDSESSAEQVAALKALARQKPLSASLVEKLAQIAENPEGLPRIEAGFALELAQDPRGAKALTAAALDGVEAERRLAIERLGDTADKTHLPLLLGLLDASPTLRHAALGALEKLVDEEIIAPEERQFLSVTEMISRWKGWAAGQRKMVQPVSGTE